LFQITQIPLIPLDRYFWKPNWVEPTTEEWRSIVSKLVIDDRWIMDGNYGGTWDLRLPEVDTLIYLDFPTRICLYRVLKRTWVNYGQVREDMNEGCPERFDWDFLHYVLTFRLRRRKKNLSIMEEQRKEGKQVFILKNPKEVEQFLSQLENIQ
jgi:adenylate kinase family enzyme